MLAELSSAQIAFKLMVRLSPGGPFYLSGILSNVLGRAVAQKLACYLLGIDSHSLQQNMAFLFLYRDFFVLNRIRSSRMA